MRAGSLALLLVLSISAAADEAPSIASLEAQIASASDERRIALLIQLAGLTSESDFERSLAFAEEAARRAQVAADLRAEAAGLYWVGKAKAFMGRPEEAYAPLARSRELYESLGDRRGSGDANNVLGIAAYRHGRFREAAERFAEALAVWEELGDLKNQATALTNLGSVHCQLADEGCGAYFERALAIQRELGNEKGEALALNNLGIARQRSGDYAAAIDAYLGALRVEERLGNRPGIARACANVGVVFKKLGQPVKALEYATRALAINRAMGDRHSLVIDLTNVGAIHADEGRYDPAIACYREALELAEQMEDAAQMRSAILNLAEVEERFGRLVNAAAQFERALALAEATGAKAETVAPRLGLARLQSRAGEHQAARANVERALAAAAASGDKERLRDGHEAEAQVYAAAGDYRRAYDAQLRFAAENDAILNRQTTDRIAEMEARYAAEKKAREIEILKRDRELQELRLKAEKARTLGLLGGLLAVGVALVALWSRYRHLLAFWRSRGHIGAYRILREIGSGGMGVVYKAVHVRDRSRPVAVKVIREELSQDPIFRQRLRNEGAIIDQIDHPNIVRVFERGESDRRLYIAMEWLDGPSLAELVRAGARLPLAECVDLMVQLTDAVATVHSRGIVHRDLKLENLMLVKEGGATRVKLLDFDLARAGSQTRLTETGAVVGTVGYLAPERILGQAALPEGDVFALGVVFYELLTLEKPFLGENAAAVVRHILEGEPLAPRTLRPELPEMLSALVLCMLRKDPRQRPSEAEITARLSACLIEGA